MKTVVNKTRLPLRVPLPGGKVLHLGPSKEGQIADNAVEHPALRRMVEARKIAIQGEGESEAAPEGGAAGASDPSRGGESTHGKQKANVPRRRGARGA